MIWTYFYLYFSQNTVPKSLLGVWNPSSVDCFWKRFRGQRTKLFWKCNLMYISQMISRTAKMETMEGVGSPLSLKGTIIGCNRNPLNGTHWTWKKQTSEISHSLTMAVNYIKKRGHHYNTYKFNCTFMFYNTFALAGVKWIPLNEEP